jgi:hypothetical protein
LLRDVSTWHMSFKSHWFRSTNGHYVAPCPTYKGLPKDDKDESHLHFIRKRARKSKVLFKTHQVSKVKEGPSHLSMQ